MADAESWMNKRPENGPEFEACNVTVAPGEIWTFPTVPASALLVVRMIAMPLAPLQLEHVSAAPIPSVKSPFVIQYVPDDRSTVLFLMSHPPVISVLPGKTMLPWAEANDPPRILQPLGA